MSTNPVAEFFDPRTLADPYAYYESRRTAFRGVLGKVLRDKRFHHECASLGMLRLVERPDIADRIRGDAG